MEVRCLKTALDGKEMKMKLSETDVKHMWNNFESVRKQNEIKTSYLLLDSIPAWRDSNKSDHYSGHYLSYTFS